MDEKSGGQGAWKEKVAKGSSRSYTLGSKVGYEREKQEGQPLTQQSHYAELGQVRRVV